MKRTTLSVMAVIAVLVLLVGVFAACKKKETGEVDVSVTSDENGSLYYTDPVKEIDGITYGGETHFVSPEETNKQGEYRVNPDKTSTPYTTDNHGNVAPVTSEDTTTAPDSTSTTSGGQGTNTTTATTTASGGSSTETKTTESTTAETTTEELHGISEADDGNRLNDDGVIDAW